jgi:hypothetical protein
MPCWLVKTEPSTYAFQDLQRERKTRWDGVSNAQAQANLRAMRAGDEVVVYHSGEKAAVGLARVARGPYPDPGDPTGKRVAVDLGAGVGLGIPVTLGALDEIQAMARMKALGLAIAPFVFRLNAAADARPSSEVRSVHWIPLAALTDRGNRSTYDYDYDGTPYPLPCVRIDHLIIWGLTHRMLMSFLGLLARADGQDEETEPLHLRHSLPLP